MPLNGGKSVPGVATGIDNVVVCVEDAPGEMVMAQVFPDIFLCVEFRAVGWQKQKGNVVGHDEFSALFVPARAIDKKDGIGIFFNLAADVFKVLVHGGNIRLGHDDGAACVSCRADGAEDVGAVIPLVTLHRRTRAATGPDAGQRAFLSDARFVLEPEFDLLAFGAFGKDCCDFGGKVFLNSSRAAGSPCGCAGRVET